MKDQIREDGSLELWFGVGSYPAAITLRPDQLALLRTALGLGPGTEEASPPREPEAGDTVMVRDFEELPWRGPLVLQLRRDGAFQGDPRPRWRAGGSDWAHCRYATPSDELLPRDRLIAKAMDAGRKLTDAMLGNEPTLKLRKGSLDGTAQDPIREARERVAEAIRNPVSGPAFVAAVEEIERLNSVPSGVGVVILTRAPTEGEPEPGDLVMVRDREEDPWAGFRVLSDSKKLQRRLPPLRQQRRLLEARPPPHGGRNQPDQEDLEPKLLNSV